jgi:Carboxypeptidase regulatory-like domain/TonB dependent receptor
MKRFMGLLAVILCLAALVSRADAQETGQIAGTVTDPSGAVVSGATLTAKNLGTNAARTAVANSAGSYVFTNLEPAVYEVSTKAANFSETRIKVEVTVGGHATANLQFSISGETTSVEVSAAGGAQVNTQTQELSQVVDQQQLSQLPSLTRNPYDFVALSGNVSAGDNTSTGATQNTSQYGVGYSMNGQRSSGTEILLDGVENVAVFGDGVGITVPLDSVQEYRIATSNFEPQYGRASGGVVNVVTKSGTNAFHGSAWEFNRLSAYTANTVTNAQQGLPKGKYTRNQFGAAIGGPIVKDKLFFFGAVEFVRVRSAANLTAAVPTPQFLALTAPNVQSYFSTYAGNNNFNFLSTTTNAQLGSGGVPAIAGIPANTPVFGTVAYSAPQNAGGSVPQNTYNVVGRVDYNLSERTQAFFRYVNYNENDLSGANFASVYSQYNVGDTIQNTAYLLSVSHEFSTSLTSITKASFSRFNTSDSYNTALQNTPTLFVSVNATLPGTSTPVSLPGFYNTNPANGGLPYGGPQNTVQINQDLNYVKNKHTMQFGGQILYIQDNNAYGAYAQAGEQLGKNFPTGLQALQSGNLFQFLAAVNPNGALPCVADPYTGAYTQTAACSINLPATAPSFARSERFHDWAAYGQDSWKATPKATFNYGVRYEYYGVQHNDNGSLDSNFFFGSGTNLAQQIRNGQVETSPNSPVGGLWAPQYGTVSPRVGLAYDVFGNGKTSFRAGYGIGYERNFGNVTFNVIQNPPNYAVIVLNNTVVTNSNAGPLAGATGSVPLPPTSLRNVSQNIRTAQTQFYSAAIDQQLAPGTVLSLQYMGARGLHLYDIKNYNGIGSGNAELGDPVTDPQGRKNPSTGLVYQALTRLNPQYSNINNRGSNGDSYYQGMNVELQSTNLHHTGLSLVLNYTYSHATDDLSSTFSSTNNEFSLGYTDPFNPSLDRGPGDGDIRHRLVLAPIYKTPFLSNGHRLLSQSVGGWQIAGIFTARTGTPFSYFDSSNNQSGYNVARYMPAGGQVPQHTFKSIPAGTSGGGTNGYVIGNLPAAAPISNPNLLGASDWGPWPAAMVARNAFRGPGAYNLDAVLSKTFPIHEQINLEFRAEGFNVLNHHNLYINGALNDVANVGEGVPVPITASKGGIAGGANDERRFGQFALKVNF